MFRSRRLSQLVWAAMGLILFTGSRAFGQCPPTPLTSTVAATASSSPQAYSFNQGVPYYCAVGVRSGAATNWNMEVYQSSSGVPPCVATVLGSSSRATGVDFVIGDFNPNHNSNGTYYPLATRVSGAADGVVEFDDDANRLTVNAALVSATTGASDVVTVWDVSLTAGTTYTLTFNATGADLKLLVFRSPSTGVYWAGRDTRLLETSTTTTFTPTLSGFHGIVIVNENGAAGSYTLGVGNCQTPSALVAGTSVSNALAEKTYSFSQDQIYWTAVGARGSQAGSNWQVQVYETGSGSAYPVCLSNPLAASSVAAPMVDFVVGDFNEDINIGTYYARVHLQDDLGSGTARVEWDDGIDFFDPDPGGPPPTSTVIRNTDANDVLEIWDLYLESGVTYQIYFNSSGADVRLFLFPPSVIWAGRGAAVREQVGNPVASSYIPTQTGFFGLVAVNENGATGTYEIRVYRPGLVSVDGIEQAPTALNGIAPNPARGMARLHFSLHEQSEVSFEILDITGRRVGETEARSWGPGRWSTSWRSVSGAKMSPGIYFVTMKANGKVIGRKKFTALE